MKKSVLALGLIAVPALTLAATAFQDPGSQAPGGTRERIEQRMQQRLDALENQLESARQRLERSESRLDTVRARLEQCADLAVDALTTRDHHNCTPSRNLISQFQWMHQNELPQPAERLLSHIVDQHRGDANRLARLARGLMTDDERAGQFDVAALAITERAQASSQNADTAVFDAHALALFLNRRFGEAVRFGRQAVESGGRDDERLMRRLRTYETALAATRGGAAGAQGDESPEFVDPSVAAVASTDAR